MFRKLIAITIMSGIVISIQAQSKDNLLKRWSPQERGRAVSNQGDDVIFCEIKTAGKENAGVRQVVVLNQEKPETIIFSAESKAENVSGAGLTSGNYGVYLDLLHPDNTSTFGIARGFKSGTHDWEKVSMSYTPVKPIKSVSYYLMFRNKTGKHGSAMPSWRKRKNRS